MHDPDFAAMLANSNDFSPKSHKYEVCMKIRSLTCLL